MTATISVFDVRSPVGTLRGATSAAGLALLAFPASDFDTPLARLCARHTATARRSAGGPAAAQLRDWFAGRRRDFELALDLSLVSGFAAEVLEALGAVRRGELVTYGELARRAGRPRAARAVGRAVGDNPIPLVVP